MTQHCTAHAWGPPEAVPCRNCRCPAFQKPNNVFGFGNDDSDDEALTEAENTKRTVNRELQATQRKAEQLTQKAQQVPWGWSRGAKVQGPQKHLVVSRRRLRVKQQQLGLHRLQAVDYPQDTFWPPLWHYLFPPTGWGGGVP